MLTTRAILIQLHPLRVILPVLGGGISPLLALRAGEGNDYPGITFLSHIYYSRILVTEPAPTVLPPSRMAKRRPFSIATG
jgi:hypothetical protein